MFKRRFNRIFVEREGGGEGGGYQSHSRKRPFTPEFITRQLTIVEPLIVATFAARPKRPLFREDHYSEVRYLIIMKLASRG